MNSESNNDRDGVNSSDSTDLSAPEVSVKGWRSRAMLVAKFSLVIFIFWFLARKGLVTAESFLAVISNAWAVTAILLLVTMNTVLGALRWNVLLDSQGIKLSAFKVLELNLIGNFFNIALPGAVSGDVVKAVMVGKLCAGRRAESLGAILFDRILGVSALVIVATGSVLLSIISPREHTLPDELMISVLVFGLFVMLFYLYLFLSGRTDPVGAVLAKLAGRAKILNSVYRIYLSILVYRQKPFRLFKAIVLSLVIHITLVSITFIVSYALSAQLSSQQLPFLTMGTIVPVGLLATAIPVLPAGVGTGHAAFYALFSWAGSSDGLAIFNWLVLTQIVVGAVGGIVLLRKVPGT
jgi:glycosyltransferase 2 family protein